jgi:hypothetical protein
MSKAGLCASCFRQEETITAEGVVYCIPCATRKREAWRKRLAAFSKPLAQYHLEKQKMARVNEMKHLEPQTS